MEAEKPAARGRPRDPRKRLALLTAARELFLARGPDAVTVDQVIAEAGVSRATYYLNFADRHDLLAAVIGLESERIVTADEATSYEADDLREALTRYGDRFMRFLADPDTMRMEPLIFYVRQMQPELATAFFAAGPRRVWDVLSNIVRAGQTRRELDRAADPERVVSDLIGLWRSSWFVEVMYGQRAAPDETEQRERSRHAVEIVMRAYAPSRISRR